MRGIVKRLVTVILLFVCVADAVKADNYPSYIYKEGVGLRFCWVRSCTGRAYYDKGGSDYVLLLARTVEDDGNTVTVSNGGWSLVEDNEYYGYFPYDGSHYRKANTALAVTYNGQKQVGNDTPGHMGLYDYMTARSVITTASPRFNFKHLGGVMRLSYVADRTMTITSVVLRTTGNSLPVSAVVNVPEQTITPSVTDNSMTLLMEGVEVDSGEKLTAYVMLCPANLTGETITVRINAEDGTFVERQLTGTDIKPGQLYNIELYSDVAGTARAKGAGNTENNEKEIWVESENGNALSVDGASVSSQVCYAPDYTLAVLGTDELKEEKRLLGDVNADGKVDATDARLLTDYIVGKRPVELDLTVADTTEDGEITMADANKIVNISLSE